MRWVTERRAIDVAWWAIAFGQKQRGAANDTCRPCQRDRAKRTDRRGTEERRIPDGRVHLCLHRRDLVRVDLLVLSGAVRLRVDGAILDCGVGFRDRIAIQVRW